MDYYNFLQHGLDLPYMNASAGVRPSCDELIYVQVPSSYENHAKKEQPVVISDGFLDVAALQGAGNVEPPTAASQEQEGDSEMTEDFESVEKLQPEHKSEIFKQIDNALTSATSKTLKVGSFGVEKEIGKDDVEYAKAMKAQGYGAATKRKMSSGSGPQPKKTKMIHSFKFN